MPHGYAVALLPVRGAGDSGGCLGWFSPQQRADLDQAVTWLGRQAWSTGDVGMMGVSWAGSTPWMVASLGNPHLRTIVLMQGISDSVASTGHAQGNRDWPVHDAWFQAWEPYARGFRAAPRRAPLPECHVSPRANHLLPTLPR